MAVIFGNQQATGLFAKGTNDSLASDASESAQDTHTHVMASGDFATSKSNNTSPTHDGGEPSSRGGSGRKRARVTVEDDDPVITFVTEAFNNIAAAIKETAPPHPPTIPTNLWNVMQEIPAFDRDDLAHYYAYLCENPSLANAFLGFALPDQMVWVSRYIKKYLSD
uniref:Uncharacterized protein n=1 Tax=Arundo donax TaxID=35708 RepID=A0A0A9RCF8_ARUDO